MTNEELRAARIAEALQRAHKTGSNPMIQLADLYETNWTPPERVDPDLLAAREFLALEAPNLAFAARRGDYDNGSSNIRAYLAGCTRGREGAKGLVDDLDVVRIILHAHQRTLQNDSGWGDMSYLKGSYDHTVGFTAAVAAYREALASAKRGG